MFQRMASSFDESSTAGVFLSVLSSEDSRCELLFPSYLTLLRSGASHAAPPPQRVPASPFLGKLELRSDVDRVLLVGLTSAAPTGGLQRSQEKSSICPSLQDFSFTSWNPEQVRAPPPGPAETDQVL